MLKTFLTSCSQGLCIKCVQDRRPQLTSSLLQCPNFNSLSILSFLAAVMSLMYSTIGIGGSITAGKQPGVTYNLDGLSTSAGIFGALNALGVVAFACEPSLPSPVEKTE